MVRLRNTMCVMYLCILVGFQGYAIDPIKLKEVNDFFNEYRVLPNNIGLLSDSSGELTANEVLNKTFSDSLNLNQPADGPVVWAKFKAINYNQAIEKWMVLQGDPHVGKFELYLSDSSKAILLCSGGSQLPFYTRKYSTHWIASEVDFEYGKELTFLARYESNIPYVIMIRFHAYTFFTDYSLNEYWLLGIFYGILLLLIVYNLVIYISIKDKIYIYYVLYVFSAMIYTTAGDSKWFQYFWPDAPELNYWVYYLRHLFLAITFVIYSKQFIRLNNHYYKKWINIGLLIFIGQFFIEFCFFESNLYQYTLSGLFCVIFYFGYKSVKEGYRPAWYFVLGLSFIVLSILVLNLQEHGFIKQHIVSVYAYNIGLLLEAIIFSRALGDRISYIRATKEKLDQELIKQLHANERLKDKVNRELEKKVKERTHELEYANERINKLNALLLRDNKNLYKEKSSLEFNVKELEKSRAMLQGVDFEEFSKIYPDPGTCYRFLSKLKWTDEYECARCGNDKYAEGKIRHSRRCTKCGFDESPAKHTIFSRVKFPITKAFYITFLYYASRGKISSTELSRILELRQKTCWGFLNKIKQVEAKLPKNKSFDPETGWERLVYNNETIEKK